VGRFLIVLPADAPPQLIVNSPEIGKAVIKHLMEPGQIFKFPAGRAVEYYLAGKLGLSKTHLNDVAKMVP